jgi:hypothetical protein
LYVIGNPLSTVSEDIDNRLTFANSKYLSEGWQLPPECLAEGIEDIGAPLKAFTRRFPHLQA